MKKAFFILVAFSLLMTGISFSSQETQQPGSTNPQQIKVDPTISPKVAPKDRQMRKKPFVPKEDQPVEEENTDGPPPKLEVPELVFDAGDVIKGDIVEHAFVFNNEGEGVLKLLRVQPTCGCTVTKYDKEIAKGQSGKVTATLRTENYSGDIAKTINVQTNDKELPALTLTLKAHVKTLLSIKPSERMTLGPLFTGAPIEKEFDIVSEDGQPFDITGVMVNDDKLLYNVIVAPDKKAAKLKVTIPADYPIGPIQARFDLKTTHPKVSKLNISLYGTMRDPISVQPGKASFDGISKAFIDANPESPELNKVVDIRLETEPSLEVKNVKASLPFIQATFENTQPNQAYSVKIHLDPTKIKVGPFEGAVLVFTNKKTITIPVKGVIF